MSKPIGLKEGSKAIEVYRMLCEGPKTALEMSEHIWGRHDYAGRQLARQEIYRLQRKGYGITFSGIIGGRSGRQVHLGQYFLRTCPSLRLTPLMEDLLEFISSSEVPVTADQIEEQLWDGICAPYSATTLITRTRRRGINIRHSSNGYFLGWRKLWAKYEQEVAA